MMYILDSPSAPLNSLWLMTDSLSLLDGHTLYYKNHIWENLH